MPRKSKKKPSEQPKEEKPTYQKSKNGRYYKKTKLPSGKCRGRFGSKKEAEGGLAGSSDAPKKRVRKALMISADLVYSRCFRVSPRLKKSTE